MLLSVGLATVLWVYVTNGQNPSVKQDISFQTSSFEPRNVPTGLIWTSQTPNDLKVTLIGAESDVKNFPIKDIELYADLAHPREQSQTTTGLVYLAPVVAHVLRHRNVRAEVNPDTVRVTLEPEVKRTVPVRINQVDALPVGFELDPAPVADPAEATISGLKQNVDAVDAVYADLKLTGLSVSTAISLPLTPRSSDGRIISGPTVLPAGASVRVSIKRTVFNRDAFIAVQTHGKPAPGYQIVGVITDPSNVTIQGTLDTLNGVTTVPTEDLEIEGATTDVKHVVTLRPPPGVTAVNPRTVTATVLIAASKGPGSILVAPRIVGVAAGGAVQVITPAVTVSFTGPLPQLLALKPGDITATIDVSGLAPGVYSLEPRIALPPGLDKDSVSPAKVDLTVVAPLPPATPSR